MPTKKPGALTARDITPHALYLRRRELFASMGGLVAAMVAPFVRSRAAAAELTVTKRTSTTSDPPNAFQTVTTFNNFYEFGTEQSDPAKNSGRFKPRPWSVAVDGQCAKPGSYPLEDILKPHPLEERISGTAAWKGARSLCRGSAFRSLIY